MLNLKTFASTFWQSTPWHVASPLNRDPPFFAALLLLPLLLLLLLFVAQKSEVNT